MSVEAEMNDFIVSARKAADRIESMHYALTRLADYENAYPIDVFPECDDEYCKRAHEVLQAAGLSLDRLSANAMRFVAQSVARIAKAELE